MAPQICRGMVGPLANTGRLALYQEFGHARGQAVSKKKKKGHRSSRTPFVGIFGHFRHAGRLAARFSYLFGAQLCRTLGHAMLVSSTKKRDIHQFKRDRPQKNGRYGHPSKSGSFFLQNDSGCQTIYTDVRLKEI